MNQTLTREEAFRLPAGTPVTVRWEPREGPLNLALRNVREEALWNSDGSGGILYFEGLTLVFAPTDTGHDETWGHTEDHAPLVRGKLQVSQVQAVAEAA